MSNSELDILLYGQEQRRIMTLGLERIRHALIERGHPCDKIPAIQVAGTNGKGSIAAFIHSTLRMAGIRSGLTISPHLVSWCERIQIDGEEISSEILQQRLEELQPLRQQLQLSAFELITLAALEHFADNAVELLILEVGLGGRLDATTAHPLRPLIGLGSIGADHCEHLGDSLAAITREKSAIITRGCLVASAKQDPVVRMVLEDTCQSERAVLQWVKPLPPDWILGIQGQLQRENAAVAHALLQRLGRLGWALDETTIRKGLAYTRWPGRLQHMHWHQRPILVDGAHNAPAAVRLAAERKCWPKGHYSCTWILGIQLNKQGIDMVRCLVRPNDCCWIVPVPGFASWNWHTLTESCPELSQALHDAKDAEIALHQLACSGPWPNPAPIIAGSLHLIGSLLSRGALQAE